MLSADGIKSPSTFIFQPALVPVLSDLNLISFVAPVQISRSSCCDCILALFPLIEIISKLELVPILNSTPSLNTTCPLVTSRPLFKSRFPVTVATPATDNPAPTTISLEKIPSPP